MESYRGALPNLIYVFIHYVSISNPLVMAVMLSGVISALISIAIILSGRLRKYARLPFLLALVTILLAVAGSVLNIRETKEAQQLEARIGRKSSAAEYFSLEYGFNNILFYTFPFLVGVLGAMPSIFIGIAMMKKKTA